MIPRKPIFQLSGDHHFCLTAKQNRNILSVGRLPVVIYSDDKAELFIAAASAITDNDLFFMQSNSFLLVFGQMHYNKIAKTTVHTNT